MPPATPTRRLGFVMFVKRNRTRHGGKDYQSILLVLDKRVSAKRPRARPRCDPACSLRQAEALIQQYRLGGWRRWA